MGANIVVLGAGVVGLTSALQLKRKNPDFNITIVGQHLPGDIHIDYTSPFAGANWHSFADDNDTYLQELDKPGYLKFLELAHNEPKSGVWITSNKSFVTEKEFDAKGRKQEKYIPWFKDFVRNFQISPKIELPKGTSFGYSFDGVVISVPIYLSYLLQENLAAGNKIKRIQRIKDIHEARYVHEDTSRADFVINATGLLAKNIKGFKDAKRNFPVRGQVLLVRNNAKCEVSVEGFPEENEMLYLMPRKEGGCIIGGCFLEQYGSTEVDDSMTQRIIERAVKYVPELIDPNYKNNPTTIDIVKVNVGLRPFREGGVRIEQDKDHKWLIHNYGAGGGGYQGSYGMADKTVELLQRAIDRKSSKL
ncbi:D-amino acid oxidase [Scheffersomyces xylosifermentans]|uniref:D-amino acid oxidase n=1 Tax=Scheffersomyces xylosifermentans TaxID=1304137 RepID=UPI00315DE837